MLKDWNKEKIGIGHRNIWTKTDKDGNGTGLEIIKVAEDLLEIYVYPIESNYAVCGGRYIKKIHSEKQALAFAKKYMRSH